MKTIVNGIFIRPIVNLFTNAFAQIREINQKYAKPHIKMKPVVKFALFALRAYLLILLCILLYKFIIDMKGSL